MVTSSINMCQGGRQRVSTWVSKCVTVGVNMKVPSTNETTWTLSQALHECRCRAPFAREANTSMWPWIRLTRVIHKVSVKQANPSHREGTLFSSSNTTDKDVWLVF